MKTIKIDGKVWWNDPDNGKSSGVYEVCSIKAEPGEGMSEDTVVLIDNGYSEAEVLYGELLPLSDRPILQLYRDKYDKHTLHPKYYYYGVDYDTKLTVFDMILDEDEARDKAVELGYDRNLIQRQW